MSTNSPGAGWSPIAGAVQIEVVANHACGPQDRAIEGVDGPAARLGPHGVLQVPTRAETASQIADQEEGPVFARRVLAIAMLIWGALTLVYLYAMMHAFSIAVAVFT